ncbi:ribonuclease J [Candidatus Gromoviella agglomerans]|uniref:ribonuclease J n=1 Tax=Candidatus Gromoviella agglomerans TaxID=2806609 RepID=UPI001E4526BD|nr:ribonuclease J [Candidatus Gromoviella agglomerans]UFX98376.1 RNase J family protein [Candidatus Gromoviella agglomerans]
MNFIKNKKTEKVFDPYQNPNEFYMVPLGGCSSHGIGMNCTVYFYKNASIIVDLGVTFENTPGIDLIVPDPSFMENKMDRCLGIVLTHAHEDHLGAVPYLWEKLKRPDIYATPFTAAILKNKFDGIIGKRFTSSSLKIIQHSGEFELGPFKMQYISITHSIPDSNAIAIRTDIGNIVHTGDWKLDETPVVGEKTDYELFKKIADEGILAAVCDSTNVFKNEISGSEEGVARALDREIGSCKTGMLAVVCFASNTHRIASIIRSAVKYDRKPVLAGRSIEEITRIAAECGYLEGELSNIVDYKESTSIPRNKMLLICTGSQGEIRAALPRMALGTHPNFSLQKNDTVIFSSKTIPGNEKQTGYIQNKLCLMGVNVISADFCKDLHVSGHPSVPELETLYNLLKPQICIPVHGEDRHIAKHAQVAQKLGMKTVTPHNGDVIRINENGAEKVAKIRAGCLFKDGRDLISKDSTIMTERLRMMGNGAIHISAIINSNMNLIDLAISTSGLREKWHRINEEIRSCAKYAVSDLSGKIQHPHKSNKNDVPVEEARIKEEIFVKVSSLIKHRIDKSPLISIHVHSISR